MQATHGRMLKLVTAVALMLGLLAGSATIAAVAASEADELSFVGTWRVGIEGESVIEGDFVSSALATFHADGTMMTAGRPVLPPPPNAPETAIYTSGGLGVWESTGERTMAATFALQRADRDGNFLGSTTVQATGELSEDGMTYTGTSAVMIANPVGETVATRSDVVIAERLVVAEPAAGTPVAIAAPAMLACSACGPPALSPVL